jgi:uncharacterized protein YceH (UPF0502 family)
MPFTVEDAVAVGARGGTARAKNMTAEQRSESARKAGLTRGRLEPRVAELEARIAELEARLTAA